MYHSGTSCSNISFLYSGQSLHFPFATVPLRTRSMIVKDSSLSSPLLIRYVIISSRVQIAVEMVALPLLIRSCALFSHTSVPWDNPEIRIESESVCGFCIYYHLDYEIRSELRNSKTSYRTSSDIIWCDSKCRCIME